MASRQETQLWPDLKHSPFLGPPGERSFVAESVHPYKVEQTNQQMNYGHQAKDFSRTSDRSLSGRRPILRPSRALIDS